jgi:hypothetical protein
VVAFSNLKTKDELKNNNKLYPNRVFKYIIKETVKLNDGYSLRAELRVRF